MGGVARRATKIAEVRKQGGNMLLLDAGDSLASDQDPALKSQGRTSIQAMNMMGYDAMTLGPLDLALGAAVLQQRIAEARFAVLSANAVIAATGQPLTRPFVVREWGGRKVAIVGLSGGGTNEIATQDPLKTAQTVVPQARQQAEAVILLSHAGMDMDRQIAESVPGIALIVSGGSSTFESPWRSAQTGAWLWHADEAQPNHAGRMLGIGSLTIDLSGRVSHHAWNVVGLGPEIADDPKMAEWVIQQGEEQP